MYVYIIIYIYYIYIYIYILYLFSNIFKLYSFYNYICMTLYSNAKTMHDQNMIQIYDVQHISNINITQKNEITIFAFYQHSQFCTDAKTRKDR